MRSLDYSLVIKKITFLRDQFETIEYSWEVYDIREILVPS